MELTEILQKLEQVLAHTEDRARQKLLGELGKVMPCKEKTDVGETGMIRFYFLGITQ